MSPTSSSGCPSPAPRRSSRATRTGATTRALRPLVDADGLPAEPRAAAGGSGSNGIDSVNE
eukprot:5153089-Lingulodinium_polyedra.AAC.1